MTPHHKCVCAECESARVELVALARLIKGTLLKQQAYFKCAQRDKAELIRECKDLESRLMKAANEVLARANVTPPLFAEGGDR